MILRLKKTGSISATNREVLAKVVSVMLTLETFMASKKKIQCTAIIIPTKTYLAMLDIEPLNGLRVANMNATSPINAMVIRHQTIEMESILISLPRIPVKPHRNMIPCKLS